VFCRPNDEYSASFRWVWNNADSRSVKVVVKCCLLKLYHSHFNESNIAQLWKVSCIILCIKMHSCFSVIVINLWVFVISVVLIFVFVCLECFEIGYCISSLIKMRVVADIWAMLIASDIFPYPSVKLSVKCFLSWSYHSQHWRMVRKVFWCLLF